MLLSCAHCCYITVQNRWASPYFFQSFSVKHWLIFVFVVFCFILFFDCSSWLIQALKNCCVLSKNERKIVSLVTLVLALFFKNHQQDASQIAIFWKVGIFWQKKNQRKLDKLNNKRRSLWNYLMQMNHISSHVHKKQERIKQRSDRETERCVWHFS